MKTFRVALTLLGVGALGTMLFEASTQAASTNPNPIVTIGNVPLPVTGSIADPNAGKYTHVGQKPSNVVNLDLFFAREPVRVDPATGESTPFAIPDGFVFVLTDIQGDIQGCVPGGKQRYVLKQTIGRISRDRDAIAVVCSSNGDAGFDRHFSTGLLFGAGSLITATMRSSNVELEHIWAEGYLVPVD